MKIMGDRSSASGRTRLEGLTDAQRSRIAPHLRRWIDIGLRTGPADRAAFESAARRCYEMADIPWPGKVIWVGSPLTLALSVVVIRRWLLMCPGRPSLQQMRIWVREILGASVPGLILEAVEETAARALSHLPPAAALLDIPALARRPVEDRGSRLHRREGEPWMKLDAGRNATEYSLHHAVGPCATTVYEEICGGASRSVDGAIMAPVIREMSRICSQLPDVGLALPAFGGHMDLGEGLIPVFSSFSRDECGLTLPERRMRWAKALEDTIQAAGRWYPDSHFVLACERPRQIHREAGHFLIGRHPVPHRLHRLDGPAVLWPDGWSIYAVHGIAVPSGSIEDSGAITGRIIGVGNAEPDWDAAAQ